MLEERFRLMYLSKDRADIKQISLTWKEFCILSSVLLAVFSGILVFTIGTFTRLYHNYRIVSLENDKAHLHKELLTIKEKVSYLDNRLAEVESTGDELRNVASLPPIDSDTKQVGIGGPASYGPLDVAYYTDEISKTAVEIKMDLDKLERIIQLEKYNQGEITAVFKKNEDIISHLPSIMPILGGRITSRFGWRIDPFTNKNAPHKGVDIPMPVGTKILATADGVVEVAKTNFTPHKDYGMELVINHGYGYSTRYAHCSKILVRKGQKVKRWDPIAEVGATGRAVGPHLHYEIEYEGKRKNPEHFIYN